MTCAPPASLNTVWREVTQFRAVKLKREHRMLMLLKNKKRVYQKIFKINSFMKFVFIPISLIHIHKYHNVVEETTLTWRLDSRLDWILDLEGTKMNFL